MLYISKIYEVHAANIPYFRYRRRAHVTPKSYLSFINGYKDVYAEKLASINEQAERMQIGKINEGVFPCFSQMICIFNIKHLHQWSLRIISVNHSPELVAGENHFWALRVSQNKITPLKECLKDLVDLIIHHSIILNFSTSTLPFLIENRTWSKRAPDFLY